MRRRHAIEVPLENPLPAAPPLRDEPPAPADIAEALEEREKGAWWNSVAPLIAIVAGLYLLSSQAVGSDSYLELIAHGMGGYFIAKGIFMGRSAKLQTRQAAYLAELVRRSARP